MTREKKLKQQIRARARKTGERYTAARRQVLLARQKRRAATSAAPPASTRTVRPAAAAAAPAPGEAGVIRKTGHGYEHWFAVLDRFGAVAKGHTASAAHLAEAHGVPGWHAQMITVAYERARGLRAVNQRTSGRYEVSVSKTLPAGVAAVAAALREPRARSRWARAADPDLARAMQAGLSGKDARPVVIRDQTYARTRYRWDATTVQIHVYAKPNGASIVATNEGLPDAASVERRRAQWRAAFDALKAYLSGAASGRA